MTGAALCGRMFSNSSNISNDCLAELSVIRDHVQSNGLTGRHAGRHAGQRAEPTVKSRERTALLVRWLTRRRRVAASA